MKKPNTPQQLERTQTAESTCSTDGTDSPSKHSSDPSAPPPVREEAWIDRFDTEATDELYEKATRYASTRAAQIIRAGGSADFDYVQDVVQSAFADTCTGILTWDPSKASLEAHVIQAIKSRTRHDRERIGERRRHLSFHIHDQTRAGARMRVSVETSLAADTEHDAMMRDTAERALGAVRQLAIDARDDDVCNLLDAYEAGAYTRADVLATTSLAPQSYRNARARLTTYTKQVPADIYRPARHRS